MLQIDSFFFKGSFQENRAKYSHEYRLQLARITNITRSQVHVLFTPRLPPYSLPKETRGYWRRLLFVDAEFSLDLPSSLFASHSWAQLRLQDLAAKNVELQEEGSYSSHVRNKASQTFKKVLKFKLVLSSFKRVFLREGST